MLKASDERKKAIVDMYFGFMSETERKNLKSYKDETQNNKSKLFQLT